MDPGRLGVYVEELADIDPDVLEVAVRSLIRSRISDFLPSIGVIRQLAAELVLALPDDTDALRQVEARIAWARQPEGSGDPPEVHELVEGTLALVGGYSAFRRADHPAVVRGQFANLYREARAKAILDAQLDNHRRALPAP